MEQDHHARWEQHYADDNLPWDSSEPAPALERARGGPAALHPVERHELDPVAHHSPGQHRGLGHRVGGYVTVEVGDLEQRRAAHSPGGVGGSDAGDLQARFAHRAPGRVHALPGELGVGQRVVDDRRIAAGR